MKQLTFKQKVVQGIYDLFYIWKQEFRTTFRDQGVLIFFVLVPLVYPLIYSFIYTNETIREVPTVVVDNSRSSLSREYLRKVDASPETSIVAYCADMEEAKLMLKDRKAYGIIYIPAHFSDDIVQGKQTQVSIFCDMSGLLYYKALLTANTNVSLAMNAAIKMERAGNTTARQDEITAYPIEYEDVQPDKRICRFPNSRRTHTDHTTDVALGHRLVCRNSPRTQPVQRFSPYQPPL